MKSTEHLKTLKTKGLKVSNPRDLKTQLLEKIISKHCRCCDFSKHYYDEEILSALSQIQRQVREEVVKELIVIRDVELSDSSMKKSRAAFNINLLIESLKEKP